MGFYVRPMPKKKSSPNWKVQFIAYKEGKKEWDIPSDRWATLGFNKFMTVKEAQARAQQLNAQRYLKRQEHRIRKMQLDKQAARRRYEAFLPMEFVEEFEARFIRKRDSQTEAGGRRNTRAFVVWNAVQRMIATIAVEPSEWFTATHQIYDYFVERKMSLKYSCTIIKIANLWGFYFCRKLARPFLPVPLPRGYERQRLVDAHYGKIGIHRASKPISPADLKKMSGTITLHNFNWIFLSVWFGLRPKEIDSLHNKESWKVEILPTGRKVLWVYQTKIIAIPPEDRWKPLPILFDEQSFALAILESGNFKRPLGRTMQKYFGDGVTLYAGRKGFSDLMLSKNQTLENISIWMGHSTIQRTWSSYKQKRKFHLTGF